MRRVSVAIELETVGNVIAGEERPATSGGTFEKLAPATGEPLSLVARSDAADTRRRSPQPRRRNPAGRPGRSRSAAASSAGSRSCSSATARRSPRSSPPRLASRPRTRAARSDGAIELGYFIAGEGRRFYGRTMPSAVPNRQAMTVRQPLGVAGLIIAANTPIANVAWKVFPALLCGNAAVLKASEDAPETALAFARLAAEAGVPAGRPQRRPGLRRGGRAAARRGPAGRRRLASPARPRSAG